MEAKNIRIGVLCDRSGGYGRGILTGIAALARSELAWTLQVQPPAPSAVEQLQRWGVQGIIGELRGLELASWVAASGVPAVNVSDSTDWSGWRVALENRAIGRVVGEYLADRGVRALGFVGFAGAAFSLARRAGIGELAEERGLPFDSHDSPAGKRDEIWSASDQSLGWWLAALPRPAGVLAANDGLALRVLEVARSAGLDVPADLSVVGVDNDEVICEMARPPLSSVELPLERIGFLAASRLRELLGGRSPSPRELRLPPVRVVTRRSSEMLAVDDPEIARAVRFIHDHAHLPLNAEAVVRAVAVSRRALERRFRSRLGRTLLQEIHRAHVEAAKRLLVHTDLAMPDVAAKAGFTNERVLSGVFRKLTGLTPGAFRRRSRLA